MNHLTPATTHEIPYKKIVPRVRLKILSSTDIIIVPFILKHQNGLTLSLSKQICLLRSALSAPRALRLGVIGFRAQQWQWGKLLQIYSKLGIFATDVRDCGNWWNARKAIRLLSLLSEICVTDIRAKATNFRARLLKLIKGEKPGYNWFFLSKCSEG